ncbi:hypothetical protein BST81_17425 [Leptolyngbya sp. 'hensonii']|uniref:ABC1 kinase family protein n=1 Tax=Leptolyngbya sp. 'hensonii' TaxID=1922337 RepID=UPI00094FE148|nr:AarF/ABC1/UbiB kinase family protein [Leptolyngbya sp. 'hensonii']OLP17132.1 hypothetical protein BST81_17425 [Leptolyngbya sp. 'hensonii']
MASSAITPIHNKPLRWQRSRYSLLARQADIFGSAATLMFYLWWDRFIAPNSSSHRHRRAQWLVGTLLDLGPTFIKIGQALSTRADLLPLEYVQALSRLQDQVPQFSATEAIAIIETELGKPLPNLFRDFDREPIAAASLGQVHKARLHTGEDVVVKVQRPGLEKLFALDFRVLYRLMRFTQRYFPWIRQYELEGIYEEFYTILNQEIDYVQEGKNADRFRQNFIENSRIKVPVIYWRYTTQKILTMEYAPGIKISDRQSLEACGLNVKEINQVGICCYLQQLLQDGFFQADPHPGNMAVSQDGKLIFYDFGMMSEVRSINKDQMVRTFFAVLKKDPDEVISTLTDMGLIEPLQDMAPVRRLVRFILDKFTERPIELQEFSQVKREIYTLFEQQPFRLPAKMTYILKSLTTLDGIARALDPDYNLMAASRPFVKSITLAPQRGRSLGELARQAQAFIRFKLQQPNPTQLMVRRLEERLEQGELEIRVKSIESDRALKRISIAIKSLIYACLSGFTLLSGVVLLLGPHTIWAIAAFGVAGFCSVLLIRSLVDLAVREKFDRLAEK